MAWLLATTALLQVLVAVQCLGLLRITRHYSPWLLFVVAAAVSAARRTYTLTQVLHFDPDTPVNTLGEVVALLITTFISFALWHAQPQFVSRRRAEVDVREAQALQTAQLHKERRLQEYQALLLKLTRNTDLFDLPVPQALEKICEAAARELEVARVSVWIYTEDHAAITCERLFELHHGVSAPGTKLAAEDYPSYFSALAQARTIAAHHAETDPRTCEFRDHYLRPLGISSMLDAPIRVDGRVYGILCHEHTGPPRHWIPDEEGFAGSLADLAGQVFGTQQRKFMEQERRQVEARLFETQRLESMGLIAGGVAHDFNNLLTVILGNLSLAQQDLAADSPLRANLAQVESAARKAAHLSRQLLAYSGQGPLAQEAVDLNDCVRDMALLLEVTLSKKMQLRLELAPHGPAVQGDPGQIRQVVMNLVLNAAEAIGDASGAVVVRTGPPRAPIAPPILSALPAGTERLVELSVRDTGPGIPPDLYPRIFDPFFSTKGVGRGLGLAAVAGIVRAHQGEIAVVAPPEGGVEFRVRFPASTQAPKAPPAAPARETRADQRRGGAGRLVLVADDESNVLELAREILTRAGYQVLTATDGREAVSVFSRRAEDVRLVVLDYTMPGLKGDEAFHKIQALRPGVPVLIASGYSDRSAAHLFQAQGFAGFVQKPYLAEDLERAVQAAL